MYKLHSDTTIVQLNKQQSNVIQQISLKKESSFVEVVELFSESIMLYVYAFMLLDVRQPPMHQCTSAFHQFALGDKNICFIFIYMTQYLVIDRSLCTLLSLFHSFITNWSTGNLMSMFISREAACKLSSRNRVSFRDDLCVIIHQ